MKKGVTLKDLAGKLHMSVSTVSKALSGDASISDATKERVQLLATEWNYIPNEAARHFKLKKTFTLGLIIPDLLDQFFVLAINGVEEIAAQQKYNVIVSQSHEDAAHQEKIIDIMIRSRVDGVIAAIAKNTSNMQPFRKLTEFGIPLVFFSRTPQDPSYNYVSADNEEGVMKAMDFLFAQGHRRIAHIMGPASMPVSQTRFESYKKALQEQGLPYDSALVKGTDLTPESTWCAMDALMKLSSPPTAVFTFKNYISLDVIQFLKKNYPDRVGSIDIVGFGNLPLLQYLDPKPLASIEENSFAMGMEAARVLFANMETPSTGSPQHLKVSCKLIVHRKLPGK